MNTQGVAIPDGWVIVEHSIFCGKDCGLRVYVNPRNVTPALAAGSSVAEEVLR